MHDNTLARALLDQGERVTLLPTYTPIRVDEQNVSDGRVFLGGISVYLEAKVPFWGRIPRSLTRWLDSPGVIRLATSFGISSDASKLGDMTLALLKGDAGPEAREVQEFAGFIGHDLKPDVVLFSNALLAGTVRTLKREYSGAVWCLLQGDDIFLEGLIEPWKSKSLAILREECRHFDGFLVHSRYYREFMSGYLHIPPEKIHVTPLGIDLSGHDGEPRPRGDRPFTVGYFARICPEKGLHNLVAAFERLHARHPEAKLKAGGYLGARDARYFKTLSDRTKSLGNAFEYVGSPASHAEKVEFFKSIDVLSVPTDYREPKGLYVLEALANGVPVVQPAHGAFPELVEATGGGMLMLPGDANDLAMRLEQLLLDDDLRVELGRVGQQKAREKYGPVAMAKATREVLAGQLPASIPLA